MRVTVEIVGMDDGLVRYRVREVGTSTWVMGCCSCSTPAYEMFRLVMRNAIDQINARKRDDALDAFREEARRYGGSDV